MHVNSVLNKDGVRAVIVLGDIDDSPDAATTQLLLGPTGSETGTRGETIPDQGDAWRLWNLSALIPEQTRYSRIYQGRGELIDHLLVSQGLRESADRDSVRSMVEESDNGRPGLPSIDDLPSNRPASSASDHAPVVANFNA